MAQGMERDKAADKRNNTSEFRKADNKRVPGNGTAAGNDGRRAEQRVNISRVSAVPLRLCDRQSGPCNGFGRYNVLYTYNIHAVLFPP